MQIKQLRVTPGEASDKVGAEDGSSEEEGSESEYES
jgi:hypothetical protein